MKKTGLTKIIYNTAINLFSNNNIVIFELNPEKVDSEYKAHLLDCGVNFVDLNISNVRVINSLRKIHAALNENNIDVIHAHCLRSIILVGMLNKFSNIKSVCTLHSYIAYNYIGEFGPLKAKIYSTLVLLAAKTFSKIVTVSKSIGKLYQQYNNIETSSIQNGVDFDPERKAKIRNEPIKYIYTGSISKRKQIVFLCEGFQNFEKDKDVQLLLLGDGPLLNELNDKYDENIKFIGRVDNVDKYLDSCDYFISCSESEGLPNAVMEAMAIGLPCILSDIPPHLELLQGDDNGFNYQLNNYDEFISVLNKSYSMSSEQFALMSEKSLQKISNTFNVKNMANKHYELYESLLSKC